MKFHGPLGSPKLHVHASRAGQTTYRPDETTHGLRLATKNTTEATMEPGWITDRLLCGCITAISNGRLSYRNQNGQNNTIDQLFNSRVAIASLLFLLYATASTIHWMVASGPRGTMLLVAFVIAVFAVRVLSRRIGSDGL